MAAALLLVGLAGAPPSSAQFGPPPDTPVVVAPVVARPVRDEVTFIGTVEPNGRLPAGGPGHGA